MKSRVMRNILNFNCYINLNCNNILDITDLAVLLNTIAYKVL